MDPVLGLALNGGMLQNLPANSSQADLAALLNQIVDKLNSWIGVIVFVDTTAISSDGSARTTFTIPHNLGFAPEPHAFINGVNVSGSGGAKNLTAVNIALPNWLSVTQSGGDVVFPIWCSIYTDDVNFYIDVFNATGNAMGSIDVTFYLTRLEASQS